MRPIQQPPPAPRFASDQDLVGLKITLLVALNLLAAALELVV